MESYFLCKCSEQQTENRQKRQVEYLDVSQPISNQKRLYCKKCLLKDCPLKSSKNNEQIMILDDILRSSELKELEDWPIIQSTNSQNVYTQVNKNLKDQKSEIKSNICSIFNEYQQSVIDHLEKLKKQFIVKIEDIYSQCEAKNQEFLGNFGNFFDLKEIQKQVLGLLESENYQCQQFDEYLEGLYLLQYNIEAFMDQQNDFLKQSYQEIQQETLNLKQNLHNYKIEEFKKNLWGSLDNHLKDQLKFRAENYDISYKLNDKICLFSEWKENGFERNEEVQFEILIKNPLKIRGNSQQYLQIALNSCNQQFVEDGKYNKYIIIPGSGVPIISPEYVYKKEQYSYFNEWARFNSFREENQQSVWKILDNGDREIRLIGKIDIENNVLSLTQENNIISVSYSQNFEDQIRFWKLDGCVLNCPFEVDTKRIL